jgi:hypothetical protein
MMVQPHTSHDVSLSGLLPMGEPCRNPFAVPAEALMRAFAEKWQLNWPRLEECYTMSAYLFPDASLHRLVTIGNLNTLSFYLDDLTTKEACKASALDEIPVLSHVLRTGQVKDLSLFPLHYQQALLEVRQDFLSLSDGNTSWFPHFLASLEGYLLSTSRPEAFVGEQADGTVDLQSYIAWRERDSGMYMMTDLIEFASAFRLPEPTRSDPIVQHPRQMCARIGSLVNDLFSYDKETRIEGTRFNLIALFLEKTGELKGAVEHAIAYINTCITNFQADAQYVPGGDVEAEQAVSQYLLGLKHQISATWHWQLSTRRYRSAYSPFQELRES